MSIKNKLQEHYQIYFPDELIKELVESGAKTVEDVVSIFKTDYIKKVHKYILNDYKLVDSFGSVKFKGSILVIEPDQNLYANGVVVRFEDYIGFGAIDALFKAVKTELNKDIEIYHYGSAAVKNISEGFNSSVSSESKVISFIGVKDELGDIYFGVGESSNALRSAVDALLSAINRMSKLKE